MLTTIAISIISDIVLIKVALWTVESVVLRRIVVVVFAVTWVVQWVRRERRGSYDPVRPG